MPNWTSNIVLVVGDKVDLQRFKAEMIPLDFDKVKPMPPELKVTSGSDRELIWQAKYGDDRTVAELPNYTWVREAGVTDRESLIKFFCDKRPDAIAEAEQYQSNFLKYGCCTWYEWHCEHWGTKWACDEFSFEDCEHEGAPAIRMHFDTAWSPSLPITERLSELYPKLAFEHTWHQEEGGGKCLRYVDGTAPVIKEPKKIKSKGKPERAA